MKGGVAAPNGDVANRAADKPHDDRRQVFDAKLTVRPIEQGAAKTLDRLHVKSSYVANDRHRIQGKVDDLPTAVPAGVPVELVGDRVELIARPVARDTF